MDIVSRLKIFMNSLDLTSTQFADSCRIARPSLSQLLNGRNKKVSDELITKIHEAFPQLSVSWLLFGEGDMVINSNIQFSSPQNTPNSSSPNMQDLFSQINSSPADNAYNNTTFSSENFTDIPAPHSSDIKAAATNNSSIKLNTASNKRISNIVVFYDDNSFESFAPTT